MGLFFRRLWVVWVGFFVLMGTGICFPDPARLGELRPPFRAAWEIPLSGKITWCAKGSALYIASYGEKDEHVQVLEAIDMDTGKRLWQRKLLKAHYAERLACSNHFLIANTKKEIQIFEASTGKEWWTLPARGNVDVEMALSGETLYAAVKPGFISAVDVRSRKIIREMDFSGGLQAENGRTLYIQALAIIPSGNLIISVYSEKQTQACLFDLATGKRLWQSPPLTEVFSFASDGRSLIVRYQDRILALEPKSWKKIWAYDEVKGFESELMLSGQMMYMVDGNGDLVALDGRDGNVRWKRPLVEGRFAEALTPHVFNDMIMAITDNTLSTFSLDGTPLWEFSPGMGSKIEVLPHMVAGNPFLFVKTDYHEESVACFTPGAPAPLPASHQEKQARAEAIVHHAEQISPLERSELLSLGDDAFLALFAEMRAILLKSDMPGTKTKNENRDINSEHYREIRELVNAQAGPQHTRLFLETLSERR